MWSPLLCALLVRIATCDYGCPPAQPSCTSTDDGASMLQVPSVRPHALAQFGSSKEELSWALDRIDDRVGLDGDFSLPPGNPPNDGAGVHVYVLGRGIRTTHQEFGGRAIPTLESVGGNVVLCQPENTTCADDTSDVSDSGTFLAGVVGGASYGVAKQAILHAVKIIDGPEVSDASYSSGLTAALEWIMANGAKPGVIVNTFTAALVDLSIQTPAVIALNNAVTAGFTVVTDAGSAGVDGLRDACTWYPGRVPGTIAVAPTDINDTHDPTRAGGPCVDIYAPGVNVTSTCAASDTCVRQSEDSSVAAGYVAGVAALTLSGDEDNRIRTPEQVRELMMKRATVIKINGAPKGSPNLLVHSGLGFDSGIFLPASCDFEDGEYPCKLLDQENNGKLQWQRGFNEFPPKNKLPKKAASGSRYMYIDSKDFTPGAQAVFQSPPLRYEGLVTIRMKYYMSGRRAGRLKVFAGTRIFRRKGDQGRKWRSMKKTVFVLNGTQISIKANVGREGRIAIDNVRIRAVAPEAP